MLHSDDLEEIRDKLALVSAACESGLELEGKALAGAAIILTEQVAELDIIIERISHER